jgi:hypothetical protein
MGEDHARRQYLFYFEHFLIFVEREFVAAALGGFDDDLNRALAIGVEWRKAGGIRQGPSS